MSNILVHFLRRSGLVCNLNKNYTKFPLTSLLKKQQLYVTSSYQVKDEESSTKKAKNGIKITLLGPNNSVSIVSMEDAKSLSKRRDLELVKVQDLDTKTLRPVYKLLTKAELLAQEVAELSGTDDTKKSSSRKSEKSLTLSDRIGEHDLTSRLKNISKWLSKGNEIRILIQCSSEDVSNGEKIFSKIDSFVKEEGAGKLVQKRIKSGTVKFSIVPIVKKDS